MVSYIIWIDKEIEKMKNKEYIEELENINEFNVITFKEVDNAIIKIKEIRFVETYIIINNDMYYDFIEEFKKEEENIYIIPKIIIFTNSIQKFIQKNKDISIKELIEKNKKELKEEYSENDFIEKSKDIKKLKGISYYNYRITTEFLDIKEFILKNHNDNKICFKQNKEEFILEEINEINQLYLPLYYRILIKINPFHDFNKFTNFLYNKYSNNKQMSELLYPLLSFENIPIKLLYKYYIKAYTSESDFNNELNKDLLNGKINEYINFIKIIYEGIKLNSFINSSNINLYYGSKMKNEEIIKIKKCLNERKEDLPRIIIFSKTFLSFSKDKIIAEKSLRKYNTNEIPVLFVLEKNNNNILNTHCDVENISFFPKDKEVIFLPFSCFEIKEIKNIIINEIEVFEIKLNYLEKYEYKIEEEMKKIENDEIIPSSIFGENICDIINKEDINKLTIKTLLNIEQNYKKEIKLYDSFEIEDNDFNIWKKYLREKIIYENKYIKLYKVKNIEKNEELIIKEYDKLKYKNFNCFDLKKENIKYDNEIIENNKFIYIIIKNNELNLEDYLKIIENYLSEDEIREILLKINKRLKFLIENNIYYDINISNILLPLDIINKKQIKLKEIEIKEGKISTKEIYKLGEIIYFMLYKNYPLKENKIIYERRINSISNKYLKYLVKGMLDKEKKMKWNEYFNNPFFKELNKNKKI